MKRRLLVLAATALTFVAMLAAPLLFPALPAYAQAISSTFPQPYPCGPICIAGTTVIIDGALTVTPTAVTSTVPVLLPNGSVTVPALAFANDTDTGFHYTSNVFHFDIGGQEYATYGDDVGGFVVQSDHIIGWSDQATNSFRIPDLRLLREAANSLQLGSDAATATAQTISAADSTGAGQPGADLNLSGGSGGAGGTGGTVRIVDSGTKPVCAAGFRGAIFYDAGGAGVADTIEVCAKTSLDAYAWAALAVIP